MTNISVLMPWRGGDPAREEIWDWARPRWEATGLELCIGTDDDGGPFSINRALNRAREKASGDVLFVANADNVPEPKRLRAAAKHQLSGGWCLPFRKRDILTADASRAILDGADPDEKWPVLERTGCAGLVMMAAEVWDELGPWDERFSGWGGEELARASVLYTFYGPPPAKEGKCRELWHERPKRAKGAPNKVLRRRYQEAEFDRDAMWSLISEAREAAS